MMVLMKSIHINGYVPLATPICKDIGENHNFEAHRILMMNMFLKKIDCRWPCTMQW